MSAFYLASLFDLNGGQADGQSHDDCGDQLQALAGQIQPQGNGDDEPVGDGAQDGTQGLQPQLPLGQHRFADDQGGKTDDDHAAAQVNVGGFLVLGQQGPGQGGTGIGHAQAHGDGEGGVDRAGPNHVRVIPGGPDGEPQPGFQKQHHQHRRQGRDDRCRNQPVVDAEVRLEDRKQGGLLHQTDVGGEAHHRQVHGIEPSVGDDARQDGGNPEFCLQQGGNESRRRPRQHGSREGQEGMPRQGNRSRHGAAKGEGPIGGHIGDVQHPKAEKQR